MSDDWRRLTGADFAILFTVFEAGGSLVATKRELSHEVGYCERTVDRRVRELVSSGLIIVERRRRNDGGDAGSRYVATAASRAILAPILNEWTD